jgi:hypothetical protein
MRLQNELITILSNGETKLTVRCIHNVKYRTLHINKGINKFCNCHIAKGCVLYLETNKSHKENLVELKRSCEAIRIFMLYTASSKEGGQSVGSLQDICIGTLLSNEGEILLKEKIPKIVTHHVPVKARCLLPYCINTTLTICTDKCKIKNNICGLIIKRPYPFIYFRALNDYEMGRRTYQRIACVHTHITNDPNKI